MLELNVGGRVLATTRAVLLQEEGLLAGMFSGRWDESLAVDAQGRPFLDFDPDCFEVVLHQLRLRHLTGKAIDWSRAKPPQDKEEYFSAFVLFLGLALEPSQGSQVAHAFGTCSEGVIGVGEATIACDSDGVKWAIGDRIMEAGVFTWGFRVNNLHPVNWVNLGVIAVQSPPNENSHRHATSSGWAGHRQVHKSGTQTFGDGGWHGFKDADEVRMRLNVGEGILQMKVSRLGDQVFTIAGLGRHPWRIHANLLQGGSRVEVFATSDF